MNKTELFIKRSEYIHNGKYIYNKTIYTLANNKVIITCPIHGDFEQKAYSHIQGKGCFTCGGKTQINKKTFLEKSKNKHGNKYCYSEVDFINRITPVKIKCLKHGFFMQTPKLHMEGKGCKKCGLEISKASKLKTTKKYIEDARKVHGNTYSYDDLIYTRDSDKVKIKCFTHGPFMQSASSHLQGTGCPHCKTNSKGEDKINELLLLWNINFIRQYKIKKSTRYKYDFYLVDYNLLIEYDGKQHFLKSSWGGKEELKNIQIRDLIKNQIAKDNNYELLRISYKEYHNIEDIIMKKIKKAKPINSTQNNKEDNKKVELKAVIFTDGSARPTNPGKAGSGIHGFIYNSKEVIEKAKKFGKYVVTNKGYIDSETAVNYIKNYKSDDARLKISKEIAQRALFTEEYNYKIVNPISFIEGYVSLEEATNNAAELIGVQEAIRFCLNIDNNNMESRKIKQITIFTDSNYVVNACYQIQNCLKRNSYYIANKNKEIIDDIQKLHEKAKQENVSISVQWVKGHADNIGNIKADILADIGREASLTDLVFIKEYEYSDYFNAPKLDALILDNFTKIIDSGELKHNIELSNEKLDITYGIYNKDINSNGKSLLPSSYVTLMTNCPDRELIKMKRDIHKLYLSKAKAGNNEYINIINLKELLAEEVLVYTNKYGYDLSLDIDNGKIKLLGENINTIATTSKNGNKLLNRMVLDLNQLFDNHLSSIAKHLLTKESKDIIDITNSIIDGTNLIIKDNDGFEYTDEKYFIPKVLLGINLPEYKTLKKLSKKIDKILLVLDNDMYTISIVLRNKSDLDVITYLNPTSVCFLADK